MADPRMMQQMFGGLSAVDSMTGGVASLERPGGQMEQLPTDFFAPGTMEGDLVRKRSEADTGPRFEVDPMATDARRSEMQRMRDSLRGGGDTLSGLSGVLGAIGSALPRWREAPPDWGRPDTQPPELSLDVGPDTNLPPDQQQEIQGMLEQMRADGEISDSVAQRLKDAIFGLLGR